MYRVSLQKGGAATLDLDNTEKQYWDLHNSSGPVAYLSEKNFRALAENANDGIILIKMNGHIVYANKCFAKISGFNDRRLLKPSLNNLIQPSESDRIWAILRGKLEENPVPDRFEYNLLTKSGHAVPVEVTASKTIWQGEPVAMMVVRDITPQKQTEAKLIREQLKLEHRIKMRTKQLTETSNALSVLARNIDQKNEEEQNQIARQINSNILPIIEEFKNNKDFAKHQSELDMLKVYLTKLISHENDMLGEIFTLTTTELRLASMIKNGLNNSEIARQLYISLDTVKTHRRNIRKKLNIRHSKINLASYLRAKMRWPPDD